MWAVLADQNASVAVARSLNPSATEAELEEIAAAAYTKAGIELLALTVRTTKRLRPNTAGVGFCEQAQRTSPPRCHQMVS